MAVRLPGTHQTSDLNMEKNMQQFLDFLEKNQQLILSYSVKVLVALVILYLGRWLSKSLTRMLEKGLIHRKVDRAVVSFLSGIIQAAIMVATILIALSQVGIQTASFIAILGAAGLAIALALQGSLSNFASGVLIILFRPFRAGDFVDAAGVSGVVEKIEIFQTVMKSPDNKRIIVPNSQITGSAIINYSAEKTRRVDLTVGISYDSDLKKAKQLLEQILKADSRILAEPAPTIAVGALADSSVNILIRPWVNAADYWPVYWDSLEKIKLTFDEHQIVIPFPQMDLHLKKEK
ncbi:mechanosensitive ion channel domain-containing protein [Rheinheimera mangrovi]|uniref:mechanosensitive ion channel domain-containing protein n=1 Tax=Rheinheimera mangrovi TaxID=2498451 RepID=UPI001E33D4D7|nr:mechanosensitive ion channel domain-containing protein [Rheinheimera mangrovi]